MSTSETITREELARRIDAALQQSMDDCARCKTCDKQVEAVMAVIEACGSPGPGAPQPEGVYCDVQIKGYQEYTGYLTEGTFCGQPYAFLRDADGREIAKFPPDSVHLITPPEPEMPGPWERPALPAAADDDDEEGPF
jgi:hypothetical protein